MIFTISLNNKNALRGKYTVQGEALFLNLYYITVFSFWGGGIITVGIA